MSSPDLTPEEIQACLKVLNTIHVYDEEHPDYISVRRATGKMFKAVKRHRRVTKRDLISEADRAVIALTATAAPDRIDDETRGNKLAPSTTGDVAGHLIRSRPCYICKQHYTQVDAFYHQLCPECAAFNHGKRDARTDLTGRRALLTGGRAKIGMYIALRLLRDGAHTTITTRFPKDAARRFAAMEDAGDWLHRLKIVGIDLRDPSQVVALAGSVTEHPVLAGDAITSLALSTGSASLERIATGTAIDAGGLVPDLATINSWTQVVDEVDPLEMLEVQLCNVTAPFLLVSRLRGAMKRSTARRKYIVNVSAMEGQFSRAYKGPGHPHTNMAKAALNMMTRTSAQEMLDSDGILMTAVDTGWITDERPHFTKVRLMEEGFHAPLDLVDGAARVYDPIVMGESGEDQYGAFLKDYKPSPW